MDLIKQLNWRYATKRMNGAAVPAEKLNLIKEAIRLAPTSFGLQAFQVLEIEDKTLRERIFNEACQQPQINEASNVLVFAANKKVTAIMVDEYMNSIALTRGIPVDALAGFRAAFDGAVASSEQDNFVWNARQTYIALGVALTAAAALEVDATPMEGFNPGALDEILGLSEKNLSAVTILALGYRDAQADGLSVAAKVRKSVDSLFVKY